MSKTVEVFIQFAHPQRFIVKDKQIAEEFRARFGGQLLGKRAWLSTIRRGSSSTLMVFNVEPGPSLGALAEIPEDSAVSMLAMQGTFYRAFSLVNGGRQVETDLFEGLR